MNKEKFIEELNKINITLTKKALKDLEEYKDMLVEYNKKFNLTAIKTEEEIYLKHFYDSLTLIKGVDLNKPLKVLDIGTGAGFPGLVLKIVFPSLDITLIDSNNKKVTFLNKVVDKLGLTNINCLHIRAEELPDTYREYFDIATSRAVAHTRILAEISIPYLKVGGLFLPMKANIKEELEESKSTLKKLNSKVIDIINFNLPIEESTRNILKIEKEDKTLPIYPRRYDQIEKKSL